MKTLFILAVAVACIGSETAWAQHNHPASPYGGMELRPIKALSDQQIADLKAGKGMSLALAAELNGYPGPSHTLELADALDLTADQRAKTLGLFEAMQRESVTAGLRVIDGERALDRLFATKTATVGALEEATERVGREQAALRVTHLKYHLAMIEVLTPEQTARYAKLRGY
jgi:Spy/CpxP family protein refolding chaperone